MQRYIIILYHIDIEILDKILDIFLPYTITFGHIFKKYGDFIDALSNNRICFLPDTNILLRAKDMVACNAVSRDKEEDKNYKIIAAMSLLSKSYNIGNIYMPALMEFIDYEELNGVNPKESMELTFKKFFDARVIIECTDINSLIDYIIYNCKYLYIDPLISSNKEFGEKLNNECYYISFDSYIQGHNILDKRYFQHDVAYCYLCKAWLINNDSNKTREEKYDYFIDWLISDFVFDPISFIFVVKYFANLISFAPKKNNDIFMRIENQVRDILFLRNFYYSCIEIEDKDVIFVSLDKKLLKLASWCSCFYDENSKKTKLCVINNIFDDCFISKKCIEKLLEKLNELNSRSFPTGFIQKLNNIIIELREAIKR